MHSMIVKMGKFIYLLILIKMVHKVEKGYIDIVCYKIIVTFYLREIY